MTKFRYSYAIFLSLAFPNSDAPKNFDEGIIGRQIREAEKIFNARFLGRKELSIYRVEDQFMEMVLSTSYVPNNVTREVSAFSQILVKEYQFDQYSAKQGRLFNASAQSIPEERELTDQEWEDEAKQYHQEIEYTEEQKYIEENIIRLQKTRPSKRTLNTFVTMSNEVLQADSIDKLDNYIKQLEDLTILANAKKNIMIRSKK